MAEIVKTAKQYWADALNIILGLALIASPWVLQFASLNAAMGNAIVIGALIALMGLAALVNFRKWEEWLSMVIGLWLIVSPWVLGVAGTAAATWTFVVVGVLAIALAAWSLYSHGGLKMA
ncbi:SPW repeat protein [Roseovarius salinarum]|uniref:SPW repeat protein n=1 Tax=Roseovarius salinarum TaxID=1981892 RepID=UPI000C325EC0|nr:SPW repeat protein [Roseovarius salinarum]